jgi:hypothetical protein
VSPDDLKVRYENANNKTVAQVSVTVNEEGKFSGEAPLPPGLLSGHYIVEAVSVGDNVTLVGSHAVYLGWPPLGEALTSTVFWRVMMCHPEAAPGFRKIENVPVAVASARPSSPFTTASRVAIRSSR